MSSQKQPVTITIVGAGDRGTIYAKYALENPEICKIVAVCEPRQARRKWFSDLHKIPEENCFSDWRQLIEKFPTSSKRASDAVIITTQDKDHADPTIAFANLGYHILLEKPMATSEEDCRAITESIKKNNVLFAVGHVLRYTPLTQTVLELIHGKEKTLGDLIHVQHIEPVGWWHYAHSYVRGNWSKTKQSSFMLMTKSCHDLDWLHYILKRRCVRISSFGSLKHFHKGNKPSEAMAADRCLICPLQDQCPYSAKRIYLGALAMGEEEFVSKIVSSGQRPITQEMVIEELQTGPYGRCVWECDNDVVDNQVVSMQYEDSMTAVFSMVSASKDVCVRKTRIFGSCGQLEIDGNKIIHFDFATMKSNEVPLLHVDDMPKDTKLQGHDGADWHLISSFVKAVATGNGKHILSGVDETLESHLLVFNAEKARLDNKVVEF